LAYCAFVYTKDYHEDKFLKDVDSSTATSDSIIEQLFFVFLGIIPWYFTRAIIIILAILCFYFAYWYKG
jgi:hypothetical protein